MASRTSYVKFLRGGYQAVVGWDNTLYENQDVYSGFYRDTGFITQQLPEYEVVTTDSVDTLNYAILTPATGSTAVPDEQSFTAPRALTWKETRLSFRSATNVVIAQFWVSQIMGWSDTAPNTA